LLTLRNLRPLVIQFLPIIVFIIVEDIYGLVEGIIVAFVFGIGEMVLIWVREKRFEKLIGVDLAFIAAFGGLSLLFSDAIFFKFKPAIFEAMFAGAIGLSVFAGMPFLDVLMERQLKAVAGLQKPSSLQVKNVFTVVFWILILHIVLIVLAAIYSSNAVWGFVSGPLLFIFLGLWFIWQVRYRFIYPFFWRRKYAGAEWFPVLDPVTGGMRFKAPRPVVHSHRDWLHPVVHILLLDGQNRVYLQRRSESKDIYPDYWDVSVGGHLDIGESPKDAGIREAMEELNIAIDLPAEPFYIYALQMERELELVHSYVIKTRQIPRPNKFEVADGRFYRLSETDTLQHRMTPGLLAELAMLKKGLNG
jgi:intracellular septation protein A/isopentenyldiphosphate isomerase